MRNHATTEAKAALRQSVLRRREALCERERAAFGRTILSNVRDLPAYERSGVVLAYASFGTELGTDEFLGRVLDDGKTLLLPRVERGDLGLYQVRDTARDLSPGPWGIREPVPERCPFADAGSVDFALIPGVAFDRMGGRLGYGGGFYDRLLAGGLPRRAPRVSVAFEVQVVEKVPVDRHDVPVDLVITEKGMYPGKNTPGVL
ncbi:5-formyltetrahydrofolate cyclo-ligase [Rubrobacter tropicus]|uniref:5-formyltetrahydrofolate cyclo-ligase n=1 Tax=Rubrobacter tropicus TaxID=2653851 RepID=A0A6G8Q9Z5_9ACTN|nr:5-formyltetrahydrofolate cyclo-ligase [Rubrobacter tropicus]QIN83263.1 5-formyltetrahydrofolate cyclo-ligase [Rubrobacter tropicus]